MAFTRLPGVLVLLIISHCACNAVINQDDQVGEHILVGRQQKDVRNTFLQYGQGPARTVNVLGGPRLQQAEFIDGLKFSVQSNASLSFSVDIDGEAINPGTIPPGCQPLNSFSWIVKSTNSTGRLNAQMLVPFNRTKLVALKPAGSSPTTMLTVFKRPLNATSGRFIPINPEMQVVRELPEDRISVPMLSKLDGRYMIFITQPKMVGNTAT